MAEIKNTKNDLFFNNTKASFPKIAPIEDGVPAAFGGVFGKAKLNKPKAAEIPAATINVPSVFSIPNWLITKPAAIQPKVPKTRIHGNCFPGSVI